MLLLLLMFFWDNEVPFPSRTFHSCQWRMYHSNLIVNSQYSPHKNSLCDRRSFSSIGKVGEGLGASPSRPPTFRALEKERLPHRLIHTDTRTMINASATTSSRNVDWRDFNIIHPLKPQEVHTEILLFQGKQTNKQTNKQIFSRPSEIKYTRTHYTKFRCTNTSALSRTRNPCYEKSSLPQEMTVFSVSNLLHPQLHGLLRLFAEIKVISRNFLKSKTSSEIQGFLTNVRTIVWYDAQRQFSMLQYTIKNNTITFYLTSKAWGVVAHSPKPGAHVSNARQKSVNIRLLCPYN